MQDKYMKVIEAMSNQNKPDNEALEITQHKKKFTSNPRINNKPNIEKISNVKPVMGLYFNNINQPEQVVSKSNKSKILTTGLDTKKKGKSTKFKDCR